MLDTRARSIMKTITWRVIATMTTIALVYIFTGNHILAAGIGSIEIVAKLSFYYLHERIWGRIAWGKEVETL